MKVSEYKYHQLDDGTGYMTVHLGEGASLVVLSTPISKEVERVHKMILEKEIERLKVR